MFLFFMEFFKLAFCSFTCIPSGQLSAQSQKQNSRTWYKIYSKFTIKTPEQHQWHLLGVFIVNFKQISHLLSPFIVDFEQVNAGGLYMCDISFYIPFTTFQGECFKHLDNKPSSQTKIKRKMQYLKRFLKISKCRKNKD